MNATERSLLLYFESCATDSGGRLHPERMNDDDRDVLDRWTKEGFVQHGRIIAADHNRDGSLWVRLSEEAWTAAHAERRARADRVWVKKQYTTTDEKRAAP